MVLRPRRDRYGHRFVNWQVGLYFLAAGIWLGAVITDRPSVTGVAVGILLVAVVLGIVGRRLDAPRDDDASVDPIERGPPNGDT